MSSNHPLNPHSSSLTPSTHLQQWITARLSSRLRSQTPVPFDVQKRIQELRTFLDPKHPHYEREQQHINIKAIIKLYEDGEIDGIKEVFVKDGKVVSREEVFKGGWSLREGRLYQLAQK